MGGWRLNRLTPTQLLDLYESLGSKPGVPATAIIAIARRESGYNADAVTVADQKDGTASVGLFQISHVELKDVTGSSADYITRLKDPRLNMEVYLTKQAQRASALADLGVTGDDLTALTAIAHNMGLGRISGDVKKLGPTFAAWKEAYSATRSRQISYGEEAITGGPDWPRGEVEEATSESIDVTYAAEAAGDVVSDKAGSILLLLGGIYFLRG